MRQQVKSFEKQISTPINAFLFRLEQMSLGRMMKATCIYLMGGDTKRQMAFIIQNEIEETLRKHEGVIVGLSAGAINMAKLGLVESHVVPHFEKYQSDFVEKEIMPLTYDKIIYGLNDNAVIAHSDSGIVFDGDVFELKSGMMRQIS